MKSAADIAANALARAQIAAAGDRAAAKAELATALPKLWNAIIDNTQCEGAFWLGEILLYEITKETGYAGPGKPFPNL